MRLYAKADSFCATTLPDKLSVEDTLAIEHDVIPLDGPGRTSRPGSGSGSCKTPKRSRVLQMNLADASDYAGAHHRTSLTHHRVSGVGVSQTELEPAAYAGSGS